MLARDPIKSFKAILKLTGYRFPSNTLNYGRAIIN
jgi:hypothetical protein